MLGKVTTNYAMNSTLTPRTRRAIATVNHQRRRRLFCWTAAAALSSSAQAWMTVAPLSLVPRTMAKRSYSSKWRRAIAPTTRHHHRPSRIIIVSPPTRLQYSTKGDNNNNDEEKEGGILASVTKAVKNILPQKWFQSEQEKQSALRKQQLQKEMKGGISEMLKDAPLGIRMMGKMIAPLVSGIASTLAETMAAQQQTTQKLLEDATGFLAQNDDVIEALGGEPIRVGMPFSQSSSTSNINGQVQSRIELGVPVVGRNGVSGTAFVSANQEGLTSLVFQSPQGRRIPISLTKVVGKSRLSSSSSGPPGSASRRRRGDDSTIIEAEIIEKDTKK
jgi:hypothetical protein